MGLKRLLLTLIVSLLFCGCTPGPLAPDADAGPGDVFTPPEPTKVDPEKLATAVTATLLEGFESASATGTLELGPAIDVVFATAETGLKEGEKWDVKVKPGGPTIGAIYTLARTTVTAGLMAANVWALLLYTPETPHADLANTLANKLSATILDSFAGGEVTAGEVYMWPVVVTKLALVETGKWDEPVGSVHPNVPPTTIGQIFHTAATTGELVLQTMNLYSFVLFHTK